MLTLCIRFSILFAYGLALYFLIHEEKKYNVSGGYKTDRLPVLKTHEEIIHLFNENTELEFRFKLGSEEYQKIMQHLRFLTSSENECLQVQKSIAYIQNFSKFKKLVREQHSDGSEKVYVKQKLAFVSNGSLSSENPTQARPKHVDVVRAKYRFSFPGKSNVWRWDITFVDFDQDNQGFDSWFFNSDPLDQEEKVPEIELEYVGSKEQLAQALRDIYKELNAFGIEKYKTV
jgi:hypothetical protein